jgi:arylsulfatase I/J
MHGMREKTLIVFHSDNGGTRSKMFAGESAVSGDLPASNAPYREGKGTLYEGGTRVVGLANWPGQIPPAEVDAALHVVDMLPTLAKLAGADLSASKTLDGQDVWPTLASGSTVRTELVYNIEPTQGAVRHGQWKLLWQAVLPPKIELFDLDADPGETKDVSLNQPEKVAELQARVVELAQAMAAPLFYGSALKLTLSSPLATPSAALYEMGLESD